jgi:hypothetical protein
MMAAKNKNKGRPAGRPEPDGQEIFGLHLKASQHRDELLAEARALQTAGKIREARKRLRAAQEIQHRLTALETEVRLSSRDPDLL